MITTPNMVIKLRIEKFKSQGLSSLPRGLSFFKFKRILGHLLKEFSVG